MKTHQLSNQSGYILLLLLIALMGFGGVVIAGFTQDAKRQTERERILHNERLLKQAKQALLQYAYNYPANNPGRGPGRLPCPDTDNDGDANASFNCISGTEMVGRFPWKDPDLGFYDAKDASGARLWYAVSRNFANTISPANLDVINSDTPGTITIHDQTGSLAYDGAIAGIAAVIIAPGPAIDRNGVPQDRASGVNNPVNYLDVLGPWDNADFVNGTPNGFVLGPAKNSSGVVVVNDQMILITAEELVAVAEKSTLQTYQQAMQAYSGRIANDVGAAPAPWNRYYPWLFNYGVNNINSYPSDPAFATEQTNFLSNIGRVPSIYSSYFIEAGSQSIESELEVDLALAYPVTPTTVGFDQLTPAVTTGTFEFNAGAQHVFSAISTLPQTIVFSDIADVVGADGRLSATAITNETYQVELWFWDESEFGPPTGVWTICPAGGDQLSDCNRDSVGNPTPGSATNEGGVEALHVTAEIDFNGTVDFDMDYTTAPTITVISAADGSGHATIQAVYAGGDVISLPVTLSYEIDRYYESSFDIQETGTLIVDDLNPGNLTIGLRYYPELPAWVFDNDWHSTMQMAYALNYRPDQAPSDCSAGIDCLQVNNLGGINNDKKSLLAIAGEHDWFDELADGFANDVGDVFDVENEDVDTVFDVRAANGNDRILIIDEL